MTLLATLATLGASAAPFSYSTHKVAEGVYAFVEPGGHAIVSGNTTVIVGDEGVAVVDTGHHPELTRSMVEQIRRITPKPVLFVVNTHWHNDHAAGNAIYADAFPGARFVAHAFTARMLDEETRIYQGPSCVPFIESQARELRAMAASGNGPDGKPLTEKRRERFNRILEEADAAIEDCARFRFRGSDLAFEDRVTLRLGKRDVQVMFLGRANTAGDAVVYVPDARVVATGDILVFPMPFAFQSHIGEWARVLRRVEALAPVRIVPGHGPVMDEMGYLQDVAALMESIDRQVRAAYRPGMGLEDLRKQVDLAAFRTRLAKGDPALEASFDGGIAGSAVERAWQEASGDLKPEGLPRF